MGHTNPNAPTTPFTGWTWSDGTNVSLPGSDVSGIHMPKKHGNELLTTTSDDEIRPHIPLPPVQRANASVGVVFATRSLVEALVECSYTEDSGEATRLLHEALELVVQTGDVATEEQILLLLRDLREADAAKERNARFYNPKDDVTAAQKFEHDRLRRDRAEAARSAVARARQAVATTMDEWHAKGGAGRAATSPPQSPSTEPLAARPHSRPQLTSSEDPIRRKVTFDLPPSPGHDSVDDASPRGNHGVLNHTGASSSSAPQVPIATQSQVAASEDFMGLGPSQALPPPPHTLAKSRSLRSLENLLAALPNISSSLYRRGSSRRRAAEAKVWGEARTKAEAQRRWNYESEGQQEVSVYEA